MTKARVIALTFSFTFGDQMAASILMLGLKIVRGMSTTLTSRSLFIDDSAYEESRVYLD